MEGNDNGSGVKRAVLYARTSYDDRDADGRNLNGQLEMAREYALNKGYRIVAEIAEDDKGASGASFELEGLGQVLEMAQMGGFDVLIPRELDRLSRNLAKQLIVEEELKRSGAEIEYVLGEYPDTPEGRLQKHIKATIAEYEREKITERVVRGRRNKVKAGNVVTVGRVAYGYRRGEVDGKSTLLIFEPEAKIVRLIFTWYVHGDETGHPLAIGGIANKLSELRVLTYADVNGTPKERERGHWSRACVANMLKNETYAGRWHFGRRNAHLKKLNPAEHVLAVDVQAIVDRNLWDAVQKRLITNKQDSKRNRKYEYLLSGRLKCGACTYKMSGVTHHTDKPWKTSYYRCTTKRSNHCAHDCNAPFFRTDQVDAGIWEWVKELLTDPEAFARGLRKHQQKRDLDNKPIRARLGVVDDILRDNHQQLERLLDLYLSGDFPREVLTERKSRFEKTILSLERERAGLVAQLEASDLSDGQIQTLASFMEKVGAGIDVGEADFELRRSVIGALDVQVVLSVEDGQKTVHARCMVGEKVSKLCPEPFIVLAAGVNDPAVEDGADDGRQGARDVIEAGVGAQQPVVGGNVDDHGQGIDVDQRPGGAPQEHDGGDGIDAGQERGQDQQDREGDQAGEDGAPPPPALGQHPAGDGKDDEGQREKAQQQRGRALGRP
jgi:site-specific DNA recombinase